MWEKIYAKSLPHGSKKKAAFGSVEVRKCWDKIVTKLEVNRTLQSLN
jgi:hypothetical protein